jgi:hypothetical protein
VQLQVDDQHAQAPSELPDVDILVEPKPESGEHVADEVRTHRGSTHIRPDEQRGLKELTLLLFPLIIDTLPMIQLARGRIRCGDC